MATATETATEDVTTISPIAAAAPDSLVIVVPLAAALTHASWNALLTSDRGDRPATSGVIMAVGALQIAMLAPFLPVIDSVARNWPARRACCETRLC